MGRMPIITKEDIQLLYELAQKVYESEIKRKEAIKTAMGKGINEGTVNDYIYNFRHLMEGREYNRTIQNAALEYFLEKIYDDYGSAYLGSALSALRQHIIYYEGLGRKTTRISDRITLEKFTSRADFTRNIYPDEVLQGEKYYEGGIKQIQVNKYERNKKAREECLKKFGYKCAVCETDFENRYGEIGKHFIHVHHLKELSKIKKEYNVDPIKDLQPVCPNCHAMIHQRVPAYTIDEMRKIFRPN